MDINNETIFNILHWLEITWFYIMSLLLSSCYNNQRWQSCTVVWILSFHSLKPGFLNLFFSGLFLGCDWLWLLLHCSVVLEEHRSHLSIIIVSSLLVHVSRLCKIMNFSQKKIASFQRENCEFTRILMLKFKYIFFSCLVRCFSL